MASNPQQTPFWREKKSKRRKSNSSSIWSESSRSDDEAGPPRPHRVDTSATDKANNSIMPQDTSEDVDLLQEDGYIGMFVRLCTWRQDWDRRGIFPINGPDSPDSRVDYIRQKDNTKIGQGAQFDVFKRSSFKDPENPQSVVMKDPKMVFEKDGRTRDKDALRGLLLEIEILSFEAIQRHRNIVNIIQVEWDHPSLDYERRAPTIYLEAADSGSLSDFCSWRKDIAFKRDVTRTVLLGICEGLQALHSCGITHGDLKPSNILIFKDPENAEKIVAKVSDFGCSVINRNASTEGAMSRLTGVSPPWDAPEAGDEIPSEYLHKTDIYSYGLIYWWYLLGATDPFGINDNATTSTIPSLTGDSATKIDGLKRLKRSQDMGQWLEQTVMTSTTNQKKLEDIQLEVPFIGQFTLCVDPANRSLERVMEILLMKKPYNYSPTGKGTPEILGDFRWNVASAWSLPLNNMAIWNTPSMRLVEALKLLASTEGFFNSKERIVISIILFRCYFEGFGTSQDMNIARNFLIQAIQHGCLEAQAVLSVFCEATGSSIPSDMEGKSTDRIYAAAKRGSWVSLQDKIDHRMYERALGHLAADCVNDYQILDGRDIVAGVERLGDEGASYRPSKRLQIHSLAALGELAQLKKIQKHQSSLDEWNSCDDQGHTPLLISIMYGRLDVALYLLEAGANAGHSTQIGMNAFHLLARYRPKQDRDIEQVHELAARLKEGGANPNQQLKPTKSLADILGPVNKSQWWEVTYSSEEFFATPLMHAIWHGENEVVSAILDARAIPNLDSVHLAAGLHRSDLLEMLFSHQNFPFTTNDDFRLNGTRLITTAVDNEAHGGIFSPLRRLMLSRKIQSESSKKTYDRILSRCGLHQLSLDITLPNGQQGLIPRWEHCFTRRSVDLRLLKTLGSLNQDDLGMPTVHMETPLHRAIKVGHEEAVQFLLGSKLVDPKDKAEDGLGALHLCAMHTDNVAICKALLNSGCDANEKITEKASHSLQTPYQIAVAKQHFLMAGCLFEKGANRDQELFSATDSTQDLTLLGWLIRNSWDVSKHQIRYLFEEYKNMPPPDFIVAPEIGLSALQSVACYTPRSKFDEPSTEAMIDYLLSKYSSYQHLEYQRRDMNRKNQSDLIRVDTPTEGILKDSTGAYRYNWENIYFLGRTYETTRDRAYNGTALLQAVRAVNYPAVDSLIKAGANTAAVIGSHAEDLWGGMTSTYSSKTLEYASTVIDFGYYTRDKIASDEFPPNIDTESTSQKQYIRDRMDNILVLLHSKGAEYSERYLNKSIDRNMKVVREEKGYIAGAKYYMDELKEVKFISGVKKSFENSYLWQQRRELREQRRTGAQSDEPRKESRFIKFLSEETRNKLRSQALEEEGFANGENKWSSQN